MLKIKLSLIYKQTQKKHFKQFILFSFYFLFGTVRERFARSELEQTAMVVTTSYKPWLMANYFVYIRPFCIVL